MQPNLYQVLAAYSANASSANIVCNGQVNVVSFYFGAGVTFGSGTLTLETSPDGGTTWVSTGVTITSATANSFRQSNLVFGSLLRLTLSGATSPTINVAVRVTQVRYGNVDAFSFTANGTSLPFVLLGGAEYLFAPNNFDVALQAIGTFGSGTVALEASPDGGTTWYRVSTLTANGMNVVNTGLTDTLFRINLTGATSPSLTVRVIK